ncbi:MAG: hypothetical protein IPJ77_02735 [Planctomycetes bacterium]|nr:hypothetical protein [Planctomycetota bacterium]
MNSLLVGQGLLEQVLALGEVRRLLRDLEAQVDVQRAHADLGLAAQLAALHEQVAQRLRHVGLPAFEELAREDGVRVGLAREDVRSLREGFRRGGGEEQRCNPTHVHA